MVLKNVDWVEYYNTVSGRPPRPTLVKALQYFQKSNLTAIDLGCGAGNDSLYLLNQGWKVIAIDGEKAATKLLRDKVKQIEKIDGNQLKTIVSKFEEIEIEDCDLLNASYALPFCHSDHFEEMWTKITRSIKTGGRFAGQIFGDRDEWVNSPNMTFKSRNEVEEMFKDFEFEYFEEEEMDGTVASGDPKHWHLFHIVARKVTS